MSSKKSHKSGDKLKVKMRDKDYNPIYEKEIEVADSKQLAILVKELMNRGVKLEKAIEKASKEYLEEWW